MLNKEDVVYWLELLCIKHESWVCASCLDHGHVKPGLYSSSNKLALASSYQYSLDFLFENVVR